MPLILVFVSGSGPYQHLWQQVQYYLAGEKLPTHLITPMINDHGKDVTPFVANKVPTIGNFIGGAVVITGINKLIISKNRITVRTKSPYTRRQRNAIYAKAYGGVTENPAGFFR